jgi:CRP-like cAMP-binding protein
MNHSMIGSKPYAELARIKPYNQAPCGSQSVANLLRSGDLVGCLNGVCRHKRSSEGQALTDCTVIVIPKRRYLDLLDNKDFSRGIIHVLGERLWESQVMRAVAGRT